MATHPTAWLVPSRDALVTWCRAGKLANPGRAADDFLAGKQTKQTQMVKRLVGHFSLMAV